MNISKGLFTAIIATFSTLAVAAGAQAPKTAVAPAARGKTGAATKFVLDVVRNAVALPQPDPQDRLRVLNAAASIVAPISLQAAHAFTREGARLEAQLISSGQNPGVSVVASGNLDCSTAARFVDSISINFVEKAEEALNGALSACPKETAELVRQKVQGALHNGVLAARPLLALIEHTGVRSRWSQQQFQAMFSALPSEAEKFRQEAPNFAAMFVAVAPQIDRDAARDAGFHFLEWLGKLQESGERNLAVNIVTDSLRKTLGVQAFEEALGANVVAQSVAHTAGQSAEVEPPQEESVSVLKAMGPASQAQNDLAQLTASLRARQAAANGFAAGTAGDRNAAFRLFDMAFSAADSVWANRSSEKNAPAVVEEVSEAAANVDAVNALQRAQRLQEPAAQAIAMLAVARVVSSQAR